MLNLDNSLIIGKGANRTCYRHPSDKEKCIKVPNKSQCETQALEIQYYELLASNSIALKHISQYYGEIDTNIGKGYLYELIRDFDGEISKPISDYLDLNPTIYIEDVTIVQSLNILKEYLLENRIIVRNLRPYNILFKRTSKEDGIALIIDNLGHHNSNCLLYTSPSPRDA